MKEFYLKNRLYIHFLLLTILFVVHCFTSWVTYIVFPIMAIFVLLDSLENGLSYIMWALPYCMIFPFVSLVFFVSIIVAYIIKFYLIYFIKDKGKVKWYELLTIGLFFLYAVMPIGPYNLSKLLKIAIIFFIFAGFLAMSKKFSVFKIGFNTRVLSISLILSCLIGLLWFVSPYLKSIISYDTANFIRYQGLLSQTNLLGMICACILSILAYQMITNKNDWLDGILFVGIAACGITTVSKNFLILLLVILLLLFFFMMFKNWKKTLIVAVLLAAIVTTAYFIKPDFFQTYLHRFIGDLTSSSSFEQVMNTLTTGRWNLWKVTASYLGSHPLCLVFGRGLGAQFLDGITYSAHNAYLSCIEQLGIVGTIIFLIPLIILLKELFKTTKVSKAIIIPILVLGLSMLIEDTVFFNFMTKL